MKTVGRVLLVLTLGSLVALPLEVNAQLTKVTTSYVSDSAGVLPLWLASGEHWAWLKDARFVAPWSAFSAFLIISSVATWSLGSLRLRRNVRLWVIVLIAILLFMPTGLLTRGNREV